MREKRGKNSSKLFSSLISPQSSHQFSVTGGAVGTVGGGTDSVLLVCTLDGV